MKGKSATRAKAGTAGEKRTIILSDAHLGGGHNEGAALSQFLEHLHKKGDTAHLVLNGDIVDFWRCPPMESYLFLRVYFEENLLPLRKAGTLITYLPGNHDYCIRHILEHEKPLAAMLRKDLKDLDIAYPSLTLRFPGDRNVLVCHGDVCDFYYLFQLIGDLGRKCSLEKLHPAFKKLNGMHAQLFYRWIFNRDESYIEQCETFFLQRPSVIVHLLLEFFLSPWLEEINGESRWQHADGKGVLPRVVARGQAGDAIKSILTWILERVLAGLGLAAFELSELLQFLKKAAKREWLGSGVEIDKMARIVIGHRHDPRPNPKHPRSGDRDGRSRVYDDGSWTGKGKTNYTFVAIDGREIMVKQFVPPGEERLIMRDTL